MVLEFLTPVAGWALGKAADTAWTVATDQVQTKLQHTDIERAIKAGLAAVQAWEQTLEIPELLFKRCDDKQKRQFLEQVFVDADEVDVADPAHEVLGTDGHDPAPINTASARRSPASARKLLRAFSAICSRRSRFC